MTEKSIPLRVLVLFNQKLNKREPVLLGDLDFAEKALGSRERLQSLLKGLKNAGFLIPRNRMTDTTEQLEISQAGADFLVSLATFRTLEEHFITQPSSSGGTKLPDIKGDDTDFT